MEEKKQVKISLGTAICIFIIIVLIAAMAGIVIFYNSNSKKETVVEEKETSDSKNATIEIGEYIFNVPQTLKEEMGYYYDDISIEIIDSKNYNFYLGEGFYIRGKYTIDSDNLICKADVRGGEYLEEEKIEFECTFKINDNKNIELIKVSGELSDSEILKIGNIFTLSEENKENIEIVEDIVNVEEIYVYSNESNENRGYEICDQFTKIGFSSDGKFLIDMEGYYDTVTGQYEVIEENVRRCKLEKYSFDEPDGRTTYSVADANWFVDLKIIDDNKLKVISNNLWDKNGEFAISFSGEFYEEAEFTKYDIKDFSGTWKSNRYAYLLNNTDYDSYYEEVEIYSVLGRAAAQFGSTFTLNQDGSFKDYVYPVTEGDMYRDGTYTFNNGNEISLKYSDGANEVKIYIINENTMVYDDVGYCRIVLEKE